MPTPLLVLSPQKSLGELISQALPAFSVQSTADFSEAIRYVRQNPACVVLLDSELGDFDLAPQELGHGLRQVSKDIALVLILRPGESVTLKGLPLRGTLHKPISLPKLKRLLEALASSSTEPASLDWLKDVNRAARHLTRLTVESSAQAALITHKNELWAYSGHLSREAAQELAQSMQKYWDADSRNDLLKFIRLEATESQHMLYARHLTSSMALALVFDAETPLSAIRAQAGQLVRSLAEVPPEATSQMELNESAALEEEELLPIQQLLGEVPPPIPQRQDSAARSVSFPWEQAPAPAAGRRAVDEPATEPPPTPKVTVIPQEFSRESSPPIRRQENFIVPALEETRAQRKKATEDVEATRVQKPKGDPQSIIETRPQSVTEVAQRIVLEPSSAGMYNLNYACLLVPRFQNHHLVGDLAARLESWVPQLCVAFGWRLEHLAIRPEYLQWVVNVPPATAPGQIIRLLRKHTSERIFEEFPRIRQENPSDDFWAPGYNIIGGGKLHDQQIIRDFIRSARQRQGLRGEEK
ncbi:MAG: hypothetical protein OHK0031_15180 [Anaerolineales bacterium]